MGPRGGQAPPKVEQIATFGGARVTVATVASPLDPHSASPLELRERIAAERRGRPFLVYRDGNDHQRIAELEPGAGRVTVGRRDGNDVCLAWDWEVSRVHAALERLGEAWCVTDDGLSRNGTWVNGERLVGRRALRDGDVIAIGHSSVAFCDPGGESSAQATQSARGPTLAVSPAQRRVLVALCRPFGSGSYAAPASNQQIADELVVSVDAVKSTLKALFSAFGLEELPQNQKRARLAQQALRSGVVSRRDL
jgi:hypothetical protein